MIRIALLFWIIPVIASATDVSAGLSTWGFLSGLDALGDGGVFRLTIAETPTAGTSAECVLDLASGVQEAGFVGAGTLAVRWRASAGSPTGVGYLAAGLGLTVARIDTPQRWTWPMVGGELAAGLRVPVTPTIALRPEIWARINGIGLSVGAVANMDVSFFESF